MLISFGFLYCQPYSEYVIVGSFQLVFVVGVPSIWCLFQIVNDTHLIRFE